MNILKIKVKRRRKLNIRKKKIPTIFDASIYTHDAYGTVEYIYNTCTCNIDQRRARRRRKRKEIHIHTHARYDTRIKEERKKI